MITLSRSSTFSTLFRRVTALVCLGLTVLIVTGCDSDDGNDPTGPGDDPPPGRYTTRTATVTYVIDGDTIQINGNENVRYIGIDTPEIGECYYTEAKWRNFDLVDDRVITMEICNAEPQDHYGRTLAHIYVGDTLINGLLLREGYGRALSIPPCNFRADYYRQMMNDAAADGAGMWSECD